MNMSSTTVRLVTFHHPFRVPGMDNDHPSGTFELRVSREPLDVSWEAYHETMTLMLTSGGLVEAIKVNTSDLEAALTKDASAGEGARAANGEDTPSAAVGSQDARKDVGTIREEFFRSCNGDLWLLGNDASTGQLMIVHRGNEPSGGHETQNSVAEFLDRKPFGPEQAALRAILEVAAENIEGEKQSDTSESF